MGSVVTSRFRRLWRASTTHRDHPGAGGDDCAKMADGDPGRAAVVVGGLGGAIAGRPACLGLACDGWDPLGVVDLAATGVGSAEASRG